MVEFVVPRLGRTQAHKTADGLVITVPPRRSVGGFVAGVAYLVLTGTLVYTIWGIVGPSFGEPLAGWGDVIVYGFLLLFLLFAANGVYSLLFGLWGVEIISSRADWLLVQRTVFGIGHYRSYPWSEVEHLRVLDMTAMPWVRGWGIGKSLNGHIAFECGGRVIRFGDTLELDEAAKVVQLLEGHSPRTRPSLGAV
jgi:hypothetical protein